MAILGKRPSFSHSREEAMQALFAKELSVLKEAEGAFARHPPPEELEHYCEMLADHYRSMLAQMMKLTSISDASQLQLKRTKLELSSARPLQRGASQPESQAVSQEKDEILALAAHDLRSPLSEFAAWLISLSRNPGARPTRFILYAREIVNVADDTLEMIRDILDIYRLDGGTADGQSAESSRISDLLAEVADISRANALRKRITMVIESVDDADRSILIEKPLIVRILENLVSNALKYTPRESTVTVRIDIEESFLLIIVRDQGPGLSEADQRSSSRNSPAWPPSALQEASPRSGWASRSSTASCNTSAAASLRPFPARVRRSRSSCPSPRSTRPTPHDFEFLPPPQGRPAATPTFHMSSNLLAGEKSPYLLQHKDNPVAWRPWVRPLSPRPGASASRCFFPSATRPATGATSWRMSRSKMPTSQL